MLTNLYAGTVAESAATPVLVIGAAGVGKSRLRQELVDWVQRQPDRAEVLFGGVDAVGAGAPFAMLARAIRRAAGIVDGEPLEARREKLAARRRPPRRPRGARAGHRVPGRDRRRALRRGERGAARRRARNPQLMGDGMRRAFEDWLAAECAAHPVLLVLEDLHWGDLGTVSFLDGALRNLHDQPLMVLALARPEVEERFPERVDGARTGRPSGSGRCRRAPASSWCGRRWARSASDAAGPRWSSAPTATPSTSRS